MKAKKRKKLHDEQYHLLMGKIIDVMETWLDCDQVGEMEFLGMLEYAKHDVENVMDQMARDAGFGDCEE